MRPSFDQSPPIFYLEMFFFYLFLNNPLLPMIRQCFPSQSRSYAPIIWGGGWGWGVTSLMCDHGSPTFSNETLGEICDIGL